MNKQREMFEAWADKSFGKEYDINGNPNYTLISLRTVMWETWQAAIAAGTIAFRCANCKHLYEEKVSLCDCMPAVQEWEEVVVIEVPSEPAK